MIEFEENYNIRLGQIYLRVSKAEPELRAGEESLENVPPLVGWRPLNLAGIPALVFYFHLAKPKLAKLAMPCWQARKR